MTCSGVFLGSPMNQTQSSGVKVIASTQELSRAISTTMDMERMYSPELSLASISGRKARMVVMEEVSSGSESCLPVPSAGRRGGWRPLPCGGRCPRK